MHHPFDGIIIPADSAPDGTIGPAEAPRELSANRRSFLGRLAGGAAALVALLTGATASAHGRYGWSGGWGGRGWSGGYGRGGYGWSNRRWGGWHGGGRITTHALGEEGGGRYTTMALGEEGGYRY